MTHLLRINVRRFFYKIKGTVCHDSFEANIYHGTILSELHYHATQTTLALPPFSLAQLLLVLVPDIPSSRSSLSPSWKPKSSARRTWTRNKCCSGKTSEIWKSGKHLSTKISLSIHNSTRRQITDIFLDCLTRFSTCERSAGAIFLFSRYLWFLSSVPCVLPFHIQAWRLILWGRLMTWAACGVR